MQSVGAVTILAYWQMNYKSGFAAEWSYFPTPAAWILVGLTACRQDPYGHGEPLLAQEARDAQSVEPLFPRRGSVLARPFAVAYLQGLTTSSGGFPAASFEEKLA